MSITKLDKPLVIGGKAVYPQTSADQVITRDGRTLEAAVETAQTTANNAMPKSGGTFTGAVTLKGDPTANMHPATKQYVDNKTGMDLLWTNASPTSAFATQTINVPEIKTATSVRIRFAAMTTSYTIHYADLVANKNDDNNYYYATHVRYDSAFYAVWRDITVNWTDGTIVFGDGAQSNAGNNPIYMIPLDIAVISK